MSGKTIACKDFGLECPFSVTTEEGQEAIDAAMAHLGRKHADKLAAMSDADKAANMEKMKSMVGIS